MREENVVLTAEVTNYGTLYQIPYYIEKGVIHAVVVGKKVSLPTGPMSTEEAISSALKEALEKPQRPVIALTAQPINIDYLTLDLEPTQSSV